MAAFAAAILSSVCQKTFSKAVPYGKISIGVMTMEDWKKDARRDVMITDIEALVPKDHLLRKIEKVMDYGWIYERLEPY